MGDHGICVVRGFVTREWEMTREWEIMYLCVRGIVTR